MEKNTKSGMVAAAVVISLTVGMFGGYAIGNNMNSDDDAQMGNMEKSESKSTADGTLVGGSLMVKDKDIVDNAANAKNVSTTVSLVKLADLVDTLKSEGPFTVFGPTNEAFAKLDAKTVEALQKPENVDQLKNILTYHVVPGTYTSADLRVMAQKGQKLKTVQGEELSPTLEGGKLSIKDAKGGIAGIETADVISSNGVTHVIQSVLMPAK